MIHTTKLASNANTDETRSNGTPHDVHELHCCGETIVFHDDDVCEFQGDPNATFDPETFDNDTLEKDDFDAFLSFLRNNNLLA